MRQELLIFIKLMLSTAALLSIKTSMKFHKAKYAALKLSRIQWMSWSISYGFIFLWTLNLYHWSLFSFWLLFQIEEMSIGEIYCVVAIVSHMFVERSAMNQSGHYFQWHFWWMSFFYFSQSLPKHSTCKIPGAQNRWAV